MSSVRNRSHHPALPMVRGHCVRVRRVMGRKHQLHRREQFSITAADMCHKASNQHMDMSWTMSSPSSQSVSRHSTIKGATSQRRQRNSIAADHRCFFNDRFSENGYDSACSLMPMSTITGSASPFFLGCGSHYNREAPESPLMLPLPPVIQRINKAGSPFSPFSPSYSHESTECSALIDQQRILRSGARAHSSGGGGSGGGGGSDGAADPAGMNPGGGDATDGDQPSEYTYRRRNAIVEGSDDAPKADDFPSASPK
ncbi:hypothetical protein BGX27_010952 [Mortierella sp. AM989]|nr:hypothetical protein BGX27_010952 [Mortierella sp. AM989]